MSKKDDQFKSGQTQSTTSQPLTKEEKAIAIGNNLNVKISEFLSKDNLGLLIPEKRNSFFKDLNDKNILPPNLANDLKRVVILTGHDLYNKSLQMELLPHKLAVSTYNYLEKDEVKKAAFAVGQMEDYAKKFNKTDSKLLKNDLEVLKNSAGVEDKKLKAIFETVVKDIMDTYKPQSKDTKKNLQSLLDKNPNIKKTLDNNIHSSKREEEKAKEGKPKGIINRIKSKIKNAFSR